VDLGLAGLSRRMLIWGSLGAVTLFVVGYGFGARDAGHAPESSEVQSSIQTQRTDSQFRNVLDGISANPKEWDVVAAPDAGSTIHLRTKCTAGSLYFRFWVLASPSLMARYRRTMPVATQKDAVFTINLIDSAGFKISAINLTRDQLTLGSRDFEGHRSISASDRVPMTCLEYRTIESWNPSWRLVEP
jgi:hypothetical protein